LLRAIRPQPRAKEMLFGWDGLAEKREILFIF
jgi:hypothetical protein